MPAPSHTPGPTRARHELRILVGELQGAMRALSAIFTAEEEAVAAHDLVALEQANQRKVAEWEQFSHGMGRCQDLVAACTAAPAGTTLSELVDQLAPQPELAGLVAELLPPFAALKLAAERNRYIVSRLLANHQASYQFWSDLKAENSASYNDKGTKRTERSISQLSIQA